jgi:putative endonuclease
MQGGYVYIMTNKPFGVLYTGMTADMAARAFQHRAGTGSKFCRRYNCDKLVLVEEYPTIDEAIAREKAIKAWRRLWKLELIQAANPNWDDLYEQLLA